MTRYRRALAFAGTLGSVVLVACGGEEPLPKAPVAAPAPKDPAWIAKAATACVRLASCTQLDDAKRFRSPGACVDWWLGRGGPDAQDPLRTCLAEAKTCDQVVACQRGGGDARVASFCAERKGVVTACDGDRLVSCGDEGEEATVTDCAALGANCREQRSSGGIAIRACFSLQKCPLNAPDTRCDGAGAVLSCRDGAIERIACKPGTRCEERSTENGDQTASCELPSRRRCEMLGARHCEGDRLVECGSPEGGPGRIKVTDCGASGLRCTGLGLRAACTVAEGVECDREMTAKCGEGGKSVVFCAAGRSTKVSCADLGMGTCNPAARGAGAACNP